MNRPLEGKVAIVTGAGHPRGMGRAAARRLAEHGASVVVADLESSVHHKPEESTQLTDAAKDIEDRGGQALAVAVDVRKTEMIEACVARTIEAFGGADILFNNAGTPAGVGPFLEITEEQWDQSYEVNVRGMAMFCRAVIPSMIERGGGSIINNSSIAGLGAVPYMAGYTATKFAIIGLTKSIASEFGPQSIRCNAICPGAIQTAMYDSELEFISLGQGISLEEANDGLVAEIALRRVADPGEIGDTVAYLAGPSSSYISGVALPVAGGMNQGL